MRVPSRRLLLAAALPVLLVPVAASATCVRTICVNDSGPVRELLAEAGGALPGSGDGSGVLCAYLKLAGDPPTGWHGGSGGAPYVWTETQKWGDEHPGQYDFRTCVPACPPAPSPVPLFEACTTDG